MIHLVNDKRKRRMDVAVRLSMGSNGGADVTDHHGRFVWYELLTTDMASAKAF